jgi:hypothetical protein
MSKTQKAQETQPDFLAALLEKLEEPDSEREKEISYGQEHLDRLKQACENFLIKENFKVGQIVKWKENLKNRRFPRRNQPAIVVQVLDEPVVSTDDESGSPYFLEKLDIVLGVMDKDDNFITFYYDSSRFESY